MIPTSDMKVRGQKGQALTESLLVMPLFLIVFAGILTFGQTLRGRMRSNATERMGSHLSAFFDVEERKRAGWAFGDEDEKEALARIRKRQGEKPTNRVRDPEAQSGFCPDSSPSAFCFDADFDKGQEFRNHWESALPAPDAKELLALRRHKLTFASPYLPGAVTLFSERSQTHARAALREAISASRRSHPAHSVRFPSESWDQGTSFHMEHWLGDRAEGSGSTSLQDIHQQVALNSRAAQAGACAVTNPGPPKYKLAMMVLEMSFTLRDEGSGPSVSCSRIAKPLKFMEMVRDQGLRGLSYGLHALEVCAQTGALQKKPARCGSENLKGSAGGLGLRNWGGLGLTTENLRKGLKNRKKIR